MISKICGCNIGSPPLMTISDVPNEASLSMRFFISASGTGSDVLSYSLQYPHARLQRRIGMMWASRVCLVDNNALAAILRSRTILDSFSWDNTFIMTYCLRQREFRLNDEYPMLTQTKKNAKGCQQWSSPKKKHPKNLMGKKESEEMLKSVCVMVSP
jgi:hypothetical protein